jgi:hypothetical protein
MINKGHNCSNKKLLINFKLKMIQKVLHLDLFDDRIFEKCHLTIVHTNFITPCSNHQIYSPVSFNNQLLNTRHSIHRLFFLYTLGSLLNQLLSLFFEFFLKSLSITLNFNQLFQINSFLDLFTRTFDTAGFHIFFKYTISHIGLCFLVKPV